MPDQLDDTNAPYDLSSIDKTTLTAVVRQVLNSESAAISNFKYDRVHGGMGEKEDVISRIYRFTGKANVQNVENNWSLILKVVGTIATQDDPTHPLYWKREVLAFQSGQLVNLPGKLTVPSFFGVHTFSEKVLGMWFEHIDDKVETHWTLEQFAMVARQLGQFNGAFLIESDLPSWGWLSQGWLRKKVEDNYTVGLIDQLRQSFDQPATQQWFIGDDANHILQLWEDQQIFLNALDRLPQTFLHHDAFVRNLL
ncbi:MAG: hypothetical protein HOG97_03655, partial [Candidatus Marinimicrobia bacterium]|nr:hypothetical protein [Candidatus Neomarinimicrobiota bacterium]